MTPSQSRGDDIRIPDLLVSFDSDLALLREQSGYVIDSEGKAPDFVLGAASPTTGGEYHDVALAGDRLVDGEYEPMKIEALGEGRLRGYSEALGLHMCWEEGMLRFFDPVAESYLWSHEEDASRVDEERAGCMAAEARVAELETELRRLRGE